MKELYMQPTSEETLSPEEFLRIYRTKKSSIKSSEIVYSKLGSADFGKIKVHYKTPIYEMVT